MEHSDGGAGGRGSSLRGGVGARAHRAFLHTLSLAFTLQMGWEVSSEESDEFQLCREITPAAVKTVGPSWARVEAGRPVGGEMVTA